MLEKPAAEEQGGSGPTDQVGTGAQCIVPCSSSQHRVLTAVLAWCLTQCHGRANICTPKHATRHDRATWLWLTDVSACCERRNRGKGTPGAVQDKYIYKAAILNQQISKDRWGQIPITAQTNLLQAGNLLQLFCCDPAGGSQYVAWKQSLCRYPWVPCGMTRSHLAIYPCVSVYLQCYYGDEVCQTSL